jgi:hypothetical protein
LTHSVGITVFDKSQPVPNPLTRYFHWMPAAWHKFEVLGNHSVELIAPWLLILPGLPVFWRRAGGILQVVFQSVLISSGNLSFLNWLTALPAIFCLDDALLGGLFFSQSMRAAAAHAASTFSIHPVRKVVNLAFLVLILRLSVPVVRNLLSERQIMNSSYDPLRLVNTYGAFGVVSEDRDEFIISSAVEWDSDDWREHEFKVKPGNLLRQPRFISPYHYRLDWQMWIAATSKNIDRSPWMFGFLSKLLEQDPGVTNLMASNPWKDSLEKPKYIRVDLFRYKFHKAAPGAKNPPYWDREFIRRIYPQRGLASLESLRNEPK